MHKILAINTLLIRQENDKINMHFLFYIVTWRTLCHTRCKNHYFVNGLFLFYFNQVLWDYKTQVFASKYSKFICKFVYVVLIAILSISMICQAIMSNRCRKFSKLHAPKMAHKKTIFKGKSDYNFICIDSHSVLALYCKKPLFNPMTESDTISKQANTVCPLHEKRYSPVLKTVYLHP